MHDQQRDRAVQPGCAEVEDKPRPVIIHVHAYPDRRARISDDRLRYAVDTDRLLRQAHPAQCQSAHRSACPRSDCVGPRQNTPSQSTADRGCRIARSAAADTPAARAQSAEPVWRRSTERSGPRRHGANWLSARPRLDSTSRRLLRLRIRRRFGLRLFRVGLGCTRSRWLRNSAIRRDDLRLSGNPGTRCSRALSACSGSGCTGTRRLSRLHLMRCRSPARGSRSLRYRLSSYASPLRRPWPLSLPGRQCICRRSAIRRKTVRMQRHAGLWRPSRITIGRLNHGHPAEAQAHSDPSGPVASQKECPQHASAYRPPPSFAQCPAAPLPASGPSLR